MPTVVRLIILSVLLAVTGCARQAGPRAETPGAVDHHVVLITIDGFAAYLLDDPQVSVPALRQLIAEGTVAEGLRPSNPTVTWPNHTTLITGTRADRHSVLFNGVLQRGGPGKAVKVEPNSDRAQLVAVPTLFDVLHKSGRRTAAINWPCTRNDPTVDDNFPDVPEQMKHTTPALRDRLVAEGALPDATDKTFRAIGSVRRDDVWAAAAVAAIRQSKPAFMAYHILNVDGVHHAQGPQTTPGYTALALADTKLRQVLDALDQAGIRERTTIIVTADHGFAKASKLILPNVVFRQNKLLTAGATPATIVAAKAQAIPEGGTALVYLTDPATVDADRQKVIELMKATEGIADVIEPARYGELGFPLPKDNPQAPDLVLVGKDGYAFSNIATGDAAVIEPIPGRHNVGYHGYLSTDPKMNAVFVVAGRGVKRGGKVGVVDNADVAPTIAKLLGVELSGAQGKPLTDLLGR
jgi:predicted AlkP superfamily pyrophosphatase or phosphodiesterase